MITVVITVVSVIAFTVTITVRFNTNSPTPTSPARNGGGSPMRTVKLKSLAKLNLDLRILHKREDGFHELRTVFQTISLHDTIEIEYEKSRKTRLTIDGNLQIPDNLILRAAQAVVDASKTTATVHFRLTKKIPMGGGLGGGSSNAAAVLIALPVLMGVM